MKRNKFEGEVLKAWDKLKDELRERRTVSIHTIAAKCERENDPRWMARIQNLFPEFVEKLVGMGVLVVAVNHRCVREWAEVPVRDPMTALRCVQLRGGGGPAAGIRRALPDDLVLEAHIKSLAELGGAGLTAAVSSAKEAERDGLIPPAGTEALVSGIQRRIGTAMALTPPPVQATLIE